MAAAEIIAYHGWGFDASCWNVWKSYIPEEISFFASDRGYFLTANKPEFSPGDHSRIIFAHSFGLYLCDPKVLGQADLLVIFGGFLSFHPHDAQLNRRSRLILRQMTNRFKEEPRQVLKAFYQNAFYPQKEWKLPEKRLNRILLLNDLKKLNEQEIGLKRLNKISKICILHGSRDSVVSPNKGRELYDKLQPVSKYLEVKKAGHALPFTHTEQCWLFIKSEIERFI